MTRRELLPVALVLLVTVTDAAGAATLSFYLLLAAVPAIVVAGLAALEEVVQPGALSHRRAVGMLHVVTLLLVLVSAALRAPLRAEGSVPRAAVSAAIACLVVFAIQALIGSLPAIRRTLARQRLRVATVGLHESLVEPGDR
ncbi:MAG TPA: hypothetical protein VIM05_04260 [Gaiellaceae bacterium]